MWQTYGRSGLEKPRTRRDDHVMTNWEYLVVPLEEAGGLRKKDVGLEPDRLNDLGRQGWEAVGLTLNAGPYQERPFARTIAAPNRSQSLRTGSRELVCVEGRLARKHWGPGESLTRPPKPFLNVSDGRPHIS